MTRVLDTGPRVAGSGTGWAPWWTRGRSAVRSEGARYPVQWPEPTGPLAPASTRRTVELATPYPPAGPSPVVPAKTVVRTSPRRLTNGPPEFPGRTSPRRGVSSLETGP